MKICGRPIALLTEVRSQDPSRLRCLISDIISNKWFNVEKVPTHYQIARMAISSIGPDGSFASPGERGERMIWVARGSAVTECRMSNKEY